MMPRLLVVSHPAVLPVNQLAYAELAQRGLDVDLVVPDRWGHEYGPIVPQSLPELSAGFHPLPVVLAGQPQRHAYRASVQEVLRRVRPDAVFLEQEAFSVAALQWGWAAHRARIPFGVQAAENLDRSLPAPVRAWRTWVLAHAAFVAARSQTAANLVRRWGATGDVRLVPHHVPSWPQTDEGRESRPDVFRVGFAGRLVPGKGLNVLVEAVRRLGPGTELVIAGDGPLREWLEREDLGRASLRLMTGLGHAEMPSAYAAMDVLVLPSLTTPRWAEQFGRVLVEALSCGVPVVGSDSGEIPWVIETTRGGRVVPEGDPSALAQTLAALRDDPHQRLSLATRGRDAVERQFSVPAVADALGDVLNGVLSSDRRNAASEGRVPRRPTIALVAHGIHDHGGMERACAELIRHAHHEFAFTAVTAELAPDLRPLVDRWVPVRVPMRPIPLKFLVFFVRAGAALRRVDVDLIHTVGAIVPNRVDVASIHFCHAGHLAATAELGPRDAPVVRRVNTGLARRLALAAERWCYRPGRLRAFAAVSQGTAEEVARHYPGIPVTVTPNGVDTARFHPDVATRRGVRAELGVDDEMVALFVGGDWERKGLLLAIEAVAKASAAGVDVALWVVGPGDQRRFGSLAADLGVSDRVRFFGRRRDTERFYQAADVFVLPSAYEEFSLATLEAAACGLPLLIPPLHGAAELVSDNDGGMIIQGDPESIAAALKELSDQSTRARMGAVAQARGREFTWERSATTTVAAYRALLSGSPRWA